MKVDNVKPFLVVFGVVVTMTIVAVVLHGLYSFVDSLINDPEYAAQVQSGIVGVVAPVAICAVVFLAIVQKVRREIGC